MDRFKQKEDSIGKMLCDYYADLEKIGFKNPTVIPVSGHAALLFKLPDNVLDDEDLYDKKTLKLKFQREYYNLQSYNPKKENYSATILGNSGIDYLEKTILKYIL